MTIKLFGLKNCDTCKKALTEIEAGLKRIWSLISTRIVRAAFLASPVLPNAVSTIGACFCVVFFAS